MGGKALQSPTRRLPASEFHPLADKLTSIVEQALQARCVTVRAYRSKPDFGDLDLVVAREGLVASELDVTGWPPNAGNVPDTEAVLAMKTLANNLNSRDTFRNRNSPTFSFEYRDSENDKEGFQVDLILVPPEHFQGAQDYFAYNDLGNLVGRLARRMGAKYGPNGLTLPVIEDTQLLGEIVLATDTTKIHEVLGLDPDRFEQGFDTLDEIFDFAMSSDLFHPGLYRLENVPHHARMRDRKRATYRSFLERCKDLPGANEEWAEDKTIWMGRLTSHFPHLPAELEALHADKALRNRVKGWFNGRQIQARTGLQGKELGNLMERVRQVAGKHWTQTLDAWGEEKTWALVEAMINENDNPMPPSPEKQAGRRGPG